MILRQIFSVSDFGQDSQKAEEAHEDDDMRELLDHVSTTATRASSIAGSIFREARADTVSGSEMLLLDMVLPSASLNPVSLTRVRGVRLQTPDSTTTSACHWIPP